jgi:hypothetical protein
VGRQAGYCGLKGSFTSGIQYHGPLTAEAILEFVLSGRKPVTYLRTKHDLVPIL